MEGGTEGAANAEGRNGVQAEGRSYTRRCDRYRKAGGLISSRADGEGDGVTTDGKFVRKRESREQASRGAAAGGGRQRDQRRTALDGRLSVDVCRWRWAAGTKRIDGARQRSEAEAGNAQSG
jgi:hypothetical protein